MASSSPAGDTSVPHGAVGNVWTRYAMALDDVADRLHRITAALRTAGVPYALVACLRRRRS